MNRPARLNAISVELLDALHSELEAVKADRSARVLVLTGAGRGFCAGLDLDTFTRDGFGTRPVADRMRLQQRIAAAMTALRGLPQPIIAAVNGPATGGGLALALASDIRLAGEAARFGDAFVRIGLSGCDVGVSWLLPRLVGASAAFELMLTGRVIDAGEAKRIGLVSRIVPDHLLLDHAVAVAREISANSPFGVRMTKEVMWAQLEIGSLTAGIALENATQITSSFTHDHTEAIDAFVEGRPARFVDR